MYPLLVSLALVAAPYNYNAERYYLYAPDEAPGYNYLTLQIPPVDSRPADPFYESLAGLIKVCFSPDAVNYLMCWHPGADVPEPPPTKTIDHDF